MSLTGWQCRQALQGHAVDFVQVIDKEVDAPAKASYGGLSPVLGVQHAPFQQAACAESKMQQASWFLPHGTGLASAPGALHPVPFKGPLQSIHPALALAAGRQRVVDLAPYRRPLPAPGQQAIPGCPPQGRLIRRGLHPAGPLPGARVRVFEAASTGCAAPRRGSPRIGLLEGAAAWARGWAGAPCRSRSPRGRAWWERGLGLQSAVLRSVVWRAMQGYEGLLGPSAQTNSAQCCFGVNGGVQE